MPCLFLPGTSGNLATAPSSSALNISGDIEFICKILPNKWVPSANQVVFSKYDAGTNQRGYQFSLLSTGAIRLTLSQAGTSAVDATSSSALVIPPNNTSLWIKSTWRQSDGRVQFFTALDTGALPTTWSQLGTDQTLSITGIYASDQTLRIGGNSSSANMYTGKFFRLIIKNGINGTTVFDADFSKYSPNTIYFSEDSTNTATVTVGITQGSNVARIIGRNVFSKNGSIEVFENATMTTVSAPTITKTASPFDGLKPATSIGLFTQIWSNSLYVYLSEVTSDNKTKVSRMNKSYVEQESVQTSSTTLNGDAGHRGSSVAVDDNGTVVTYPEGHNTAWIGKHSTSTNNLSTLTATTTPSGATGSNAYKRYFRNKYDGSLWMTQRGDGWYGYVRKWNNSTKTWTTMGGSPLVGYGGSEENSVYGMELAFAPSTIYLSIEWSDDGTGYPRRDVTVIKSTDGGSTWTDMVGIPLGAPIKPGDSHVALPSSYKIRNAVGSRLAVDGNGLPVVISPYTRTLGTKRSLYVSRWDAGNERFIYQKVLAYTGSTSIGNPSVMEYQGVIYVLLSQYDEHEDTNWSVSNPTTPWARTGEMYLLKSDNGGRTWSKYVLDDGLQTDVWYGGYFDSEALRVDSKIRIYPICGSSFSKSEIWEFSL